MLHHRSMVSVISRGSRMVSVKARHEGSRVSVKARHEGSRVSVKAPHRSMVSVKASTRVAGGVRKHGTRVAG